MLHGHPISAKLPEDPSFGDRFWYWRGQSGRAYIHSIYDKTACPPLSNAVYVLVQVRDGRRIAMNVGHLHPARNNDIHLELNPQWNEADEIHVHLLARDSNSASGVELDLMNALGVVNQTAKPCVGHLEDNQLALALF